MREEQHVLPSLVLCHIVYLGSPVIRDNGTQSQEKERFTQGQLAGAHQLQNKDQSLVGGIFCGVVASGGLSSS